MLEEIPSGDRSRAARTLAAPAGDLDEAVNADRCALDVWIRMGAQYYRKEGGEDLSQRETMERLLLLRDVPLFSELSLEQLHAISQIMTENQYLSREVVFREGDPAGDLYLLIEGRAQVVTAHGTPERVVLGVH